ncbi:MAG: SurA N-terminal domain-containing protein [Rhodospirillales bacterium]|nr:SurA N-terminal domain-containing protein [Rhodospirillales bacterium]MBO6786759.1 SurA N-terminal domain-containing protein [Rhodospirillales bacterium]
MLQAIRSKTASLVVKILAGLLIISFAAWGIEDFIGTKASELTVASVGDADIDPVEFDYELSRETQRLRQVFGGQLTEEQINNLGIGNAVLQRMINDAALAQKASELGLLVSDDQVTKAIHSDETFKGFDGNFSRQRFNEVMRANGFPESVYIERVRGDIALRQMLGAVDNAPAAPKKLTEMLRAFRFEKRTADTLLIKAEDQPDPGEPTEEQIKKVYDDQAQRFTAPEYRKITFVHLDPALLMDGVQVTEEDLQAAYDANAQNYIKAEQRDVQMIVLTDEERAKEAARMLAEGQDFMDVATGFAEMEEAAVNLGAVTREGLLPDLAEAVFAVDKGAIAGPIKSPLGWHILKAVDVDPGFTKPLEEVRDEVTQIVKRERAVDALYDLSARFEDQIGGGATLEEAGRRVGADAVTIDAVDRDGMTPDGAKAAGLPDLASLLPVAFAADEGIESELTEAGDKGFFMLRVDKVIAPALRPLDQVRNDVIAAWKDVERTKAAEQQAKEMAQLIDGGTQFSTLAETVPASIESVGPISRNDRDKASVSVIAEMFELDAGKAGIARIGNDFKVVHVRDVTGPAAGEAGKTAAELDDLLDQDVGRDLSAQLIEAMRSELGVSVNQRVYNAVIAPGRFDPRQPL